MATYVASQAQSGIQPKAIHAGEQSVVSTYSLTATLSAGDIIQFCKLPSGARVTTCELMTNVNIFAMAGEVNVGTRASSTGLIKSVTPSANLKFTINQQSGLGFELSLTDAASPQYSMVELSVTTGVTGTTSGAISLLIKYIMDQNAA